MIQVLASETQILAPIVLQDIALLPFYLNHKLPKQGTGTADFLRPLGSFFSGSEGNVSLSLYQILSLFLTMQLFVKVVGAELMYVF